MKYELVVRDGFRAMNEEVNELLKEGWQLQGGTSISHAHNGTIYYCQAIIKHDEVNYNVSKSMNVGPSKNDIQSQINARMEDYIK